jgi:hypothetical protein
MIAWRLGLVVSVGLVCLSLGLAQNADQWYALGQAAMKRGDFAAAVTAFQNAATKNPTAANWRWLGEAHAKLEQYDQAGAAFDRAIAKYRAGGDKVTAQALENRTNPYRQQGEVYIWLPSKPQGNKALLEPDNGVLTGMYVDETGIDRSDMLQTPNQFSTNFAVYFRYHRLIKPEQSSPARQFFPDRFFKAVRKAGGMVHLAIEPATPLRQISRSLLERFAIQVRNSGVPTFIRFAGEFNDPSNEWSKDPKLFIEKFRLVADVFHAIAPNAATVWMPMASRLEVLDAYYPGQKYVDWVGISMYSTPFSNGDVRQNNIRVSPSDQLRTIYAKYATRHPIQISEYASSHETLLTPLVDYSAFAIQKMQMLYWGVAQRYPRVKNINWLHIDMIRSKYITPSRAAERRNNYALLGEKQNAFRTMLQHPIFVHNDAMQPSAMPSLFPSRIRADAPFDVTAWVKTYDPLPARVEYWLDGTLAASSQRIPYSVKLPALNSGQHKLELKVFAESGKLLLLRSQNFSAE